MDKVAQKKLEETPTWAVAVVCFVMLAISIIIEHGIEAIEKVINSDQLLFRQNQL